MADMAFALSVEEEAFFAADTRDASCVAAALSAAEDVELLSIAAADLARESSCESLIDEELDVEPVVP